MSFFTKIYLIKPLALSSVQSIQALNVKAIPQSLPFHPMLLKPPKKYSCSPTRALYNDHTRPPVVAVVVKCVGTPTIEYRFVTTDPINIISMRSSFEPPIQSAKVLTVFPNDAGFFKATCKGKEL